MHKKIALRRLFPKNWSIETSNPQASQSLTQLDKRGEGGAGFRTDMVQYMLIDVLTN